MARFFDMSLTGDAHLQRKFDRLTRKVQGKLVRQALRKAGKLVKDEAESRLQFISPGAEGSGALAAAGLKLRASRSKATTRRQRQVGVAILTPDRADLDISPDDRFYYPAIIEYGDHNTPPEPYLRGSADAMRPQVANTIRDELQLGILREARK